MDLIRPGDEQSRSLPKLPTFERRAPRSLRDDEIRVFRDFSRSRLKIGNYWGVGRPYVCALCGDVIGGLVTFSDGVLDQISEDRWGSVTRVSQCDTCATLVVPTISIADRIGLLEDELARIRRMVPPSGGAYNPDLFGAGLFGNGFDGDATPTTSTLARSMYYRSLEILATRTLSPAAFRIHSQTFVILDPPTTTATAAGIIAHKGTAGGNGAAGGTAGTAGGGHTAQDLGGGGAGAAGGAGGATTGASGSHGGSARLFEASGPQNGGGGGTGGTGSSGSGGTGGNSGTATARPVRHMDPNLFSGVSASIQGVGGSTGGGGGGGGGGDGTAGGGGGGSGGGGGVLFVACQEIDNDGEIQANGGNGGDGGTPAAGNRGGGAAGGGGGGGLVILVYRFLTDLGTIVVTGGLGGTGGAGTGTGTGGQNGGGAGDGKILRYSTLYGRFEGTAV